MSRRRGGSRRSRSLENVPAGPRRGVTGGHNPAGGTTRRAAHAGSVEQAEDALILFDVAAIFAVVTRNADCSHHRGFLAPDTGAGGCGARGGLDRAAPVAEV